MRARLFSTREGNMGPRNVRCEQATEREEKEKEVHAQSER